MELNAYQEEAKQFAIPNDNEMLEALCGLQEEAGEVAGKFKRLYRGDPALQNPSMFKEIVALELGDIAWYLARLSGLLGLTLEDVAKANLSKLYARRDANKLMGEGDYR